MHPEARPSAGFFVSQPHEENNSESLVGTAAGGAFCVVGAHEMLDESKFLARIQRLVNRGILDPQTVHLPSGNYVIKRPQLEPSRSKYDANGWSRKPLPNGGYSTEFLDTVIERWEKAGKLDLLAYMWTGCAGIHPQEMFAAYTPDQQANVVGTLSHWNNLTRLIGSSSQDEARQLIDNARVGILPNPWRPIIDHRWNGSRPVRGDVPVETYPVIILMDMDLSDASEFDELNQLVVYHLERHGPPEFRHTSDFG